MLLIALAVAPIASILPVLVVRWVANRRLAKFEEQFPEAIDLIARGLRAGHALTTALGMVAEEAPEPVRTEFRLLYDRQNFGMPLSDAFKSFAERVPLIDARFFATSVLTQRESGGNLGEVLDNLSALIRERFKLKRHVRAVSAHGRMTGWLLSMLPMVDRGDPGRHCTGVHRHHVHRPARQDDCRSGAGHAGNRLRSSCAASSTSRSDRDTMSITLAISLVAVFICVALFSQLVLSQVLSWNAPERKRLRDLEPAATGVLLDDAQLVDAPIPALRRLSKAVPKSPKDLGRLRRKLATAGYYDMRAVIYFSAAKYACPAVLAVLVLLVWGLSDWPTAGAVAGIGVFRCRNSG